MTMRDILVAIGVLVAVILTVAGLSGACSFAPGGPTVDASRLPVVDAPAELRALAPAVPFGIRIPAVPPTWRANSVDQDRVAEGGARAVRTGYVTPGGRYVRLLQSDATEPVLLAVETGARPVTAKGVEDVGGQAWVVYDGREPIWTTELADGTRMLITGSGTDDDFRTVAATALLPPV